MAIRRLVGGMVLRRRVRPDAGFTLIEVIVALAILSLLSTSLLTLFIRAMATADGNSDRQAATSVANQVLENARTVSPRIPDGGAAGNSAIVRGRFSTAVTTQWNAATGTALLTPLGQTDNVWDPTATSGSTPTVPLSSTVLVGTTTFTAQTYLGTCMRAAGTASTACVPTAGAPAGSVLMFRVIVSVTWGTATACSGGPCQYVVSSLIDPSSDKTFNTNQAVPVATDDAATTPYNTLVNIDVLGNDTGSLDITSVVVATSPSHGTVSVRPDGTINYTPATNYVGTDSFTYNVSNTLGVRSNDATVLITVSPPPAPVAANDAATTPGNASVVVPVQGNDSGTGTLTTSIVTPPASGSAVVGASGSITYTPATNVAPYTASFTYRVTDAFGQTSNTATVSVTVTLPTAPTAGNSTISLARNGSTTVDFLSNDTGTGPLTWSIVSAPNSAYGTLSASSGTGTTTFTAKNSWTGTSSFTYRVTDPFGQVSNTATVTFTVYGPPVAVAETLTGSFNTPSTFSILGNDTGATPLTVTLTQVPSAAQGTVVLNANGTVTFTPATNFYGSTTFAYRLTDPYGQTSSTVTDQINVAQPAVPTAVNDTATVKRNGNVVNVSVLTNDTYATAVTVTIVSGPVRQGTSTSQGTASVQSGGVIRYTSSGTFRGNVTVTYRLTDIWGRTSNTATVTISVTT
ncbi:MAG: type II secretion system protein [Actinomycetota bacterium]|nr:MAG: type II secretion system protein [Actinomycetota bacterium]